MDDHNIHKMMPSDKTRLTVAIAGIIISKVLSFNQAQKPRFNKVLDLARTLSKCYQPPNRKIIYKDLLDAIHDHNMERNLSLIKKESGIFGFLFLGDGATIYRIPLLNILVSGENIPVAVLELVDCQGYLVYGGETDRNFVCARFIEHIKLILISQS